MLYTSVSSLSPPPPPPLPTKAARNALRNDESLVQLRKDWSGLDLSAVFAHTLYAITPLDIPDKYLMMVPECESSCAACSRPVTCSLYT